MLLLAWLAVAALGLMVASALIQVVMRYGLRAPPVWTEELARYAMVWAGLLGAVVAIHARADPVVVRGWSARSDWRRRVAGVFRAVGVTIFLGPIVWYCVFGAGMKMTRGFLARSAGRQAEMLEVPMIWVTAVVPLALACIVIVAWLQVVLGDSGADSNSASD